MCYGSGCKNEVTSGKNAGNCGAGKNCKCPEDGTCETCSRRKGTYCPIMKEHVRDGDSCWKYRKTKKEETK